MRYLLFNILPKWQDQPKVIYNDLFNLVRKIPVDDLDGPGNIVSLMAGGNGIDESIFNGNASMGALRRVGMLKAEDLSSPSRLTRCDVAEQQESAQLLCSRSQAVAS